MTIEEMRQAIGWKVIEAVPFDIGKECKCLTCNLRFCKCLFRPENKRIIRLADILIPMKYSYFVDVTGDFWIWRKEDVTPECLGHEWNLRKDDLIEQTDDTISFLYGLLCK